MKQSEENFLLALIAGEGCFCISHHIDDDYSFGVLPSFQFYISMKDDEEILRHFQKETGLGNIKEYGDSTHWRINSKSGSIEFCNMIDEMDTELYEMTSKWSSYEKFSEAVKEYSESGVTRGSIEKSISASRSINPDGTGFKRSESELMSRVERNC